MKSRIVAALLGLGFGAHGAAHAEPLELGAKAPAVIGVDQNGAIVDLGKLYEMGLVLVYFYPKANTPGCTAQACSLRDAYEKLVERGVTVVGVSADDVAAQKSFADGQHLPFTLIADKERKVIDAFGVPKNAMGFSSRQAFLMKRGVVVWRDLKASTAQQAADVLAAMDTLEKTPAG